VSEFSICHFELSFGGCVIEFLSPFMFFVFFNWWVWRVPKSKKPNGFGASQNPKSQMFGKKLTEFSFG
jgi:hypothetical protein